ADAEAGGFFLTARDHEPLVDRPKMVFDGSIPSGNAVATRVMLRLAWLTGEERYRELAERTLRLFAAQMDKQPFGTASLLCVLDDYLSGPLDIVVIGDRADPRTGELRQAAADVYAPNKSLMLVAPGHPDEYLPEAVRGKGLVEGKPTAYVCRSFVCSSPVTAAEELRRLLAA